MKLSILVASLLSTLLVGTSADWNGEYDDPIYGGNIFICVSDIGGVLYGQGTFSRIGYMRGTVTSGDVFTGEFWLQGWEGSHGTFSLTLTGSAYSGTFTQLPGITYSISGTKTSSTIPSDLDCQRSDDYLLTSSEYYSSSGTYIPVGGKDKGVVSNAIQESETGRGTVVGSYQYVFSSSSELVHGTEYSTSYLNGQVKTGRWSEADDASGINMYVAKNNTHHYTSWWYIQRLADFDYNDSTDPDLEGHALMEKVDPLTLPSDSRDASENVCYELFTVNDENTCFGYYSDTTAQDDDAEVAIGTSSLIFSLLGFIAVVLLGILTLVEVRKISATSSNSEARVTSPTTTTTSELHKDKL